MALAFNFRSAQITTTASTVYTGTTTYTPASSSLLVAFVCGCSTVTQVDPTGVTGHGATFTKISAGGAISNSHITSVWVANSGASPTSGAASAAFAASRTGGVIIEYEITGAALAAGTTQAIVQSPTSTGTGTFGTVTLSAAGSTQNLPIAFYVHLASEVTTPKAGWTEDVGADGNFASPATGAEVQYQASAFETGSSATWTSSAAWRGSALEIKAVQSFTYTAVTTNADTKLAGTATKTLTKMGVVATTDVKAKGGATQAVVKQFIVTAAGLILAGSGTSAHYRSFAYPAVTQDVRLTGTATQVVVKIGGVSTQDVRLAGIGTYAPVLAHYYTTVAQDVRAAGTAALAIGKVASVATQDIILAGAGTITRTDVFEPSVALVDVRLAGSGTYNLSAGALHPYAGTGGAIVQGDGLYSREVVYPYVITPEDIHVGGDGVTLNLRVFPYTGQEGAVLAGAAALSFERIGAVGLEDVVLAGAGVYSYTAAGMYAGTGGVVLSGTYWPYGNVIRFKSLSLTSAGFASVEYLPRKRA